MDNISLENSKILNIHLALSQYPILADEIRVKMREALYQRGIITYADLEHEVEEKAVQSQKREGLYDPFGQESTRNWQKRLQIIRDNLTDFYFAYNLPYDLFEQLIETEIQEQSPDKVVDLTLNPEMTPWAVLFSRAKAYEALPPEERIHIAHHLQEILVVLTKTLVSDHLRFIGISRQHFTIDDMEKILRNRIGRGKIGGKAAGMQLAYKILQTPEPEDQIDVSSYIDIPKSYYIGSDVYYNFISDNNLLVYMNQKYKAIEVVESEASHIRSALLEGRFSREVKRQLADILENVDGNPLIVRSSSLLEDNWGTAFAGKYDSFFCANQGSMEENMAALMQAIKQVYASTVNPETIIYRRHKGLLDYDERMAVLIQEVVGARYKNYFFPTMAGVAFSHNPFRWNQQIKAKAGFMRLVWGLGTRAVDRVGQDYPRMIALSHPQLRPETSRDEIKQYSQHFIDLVDINENTFKTLPVADVIQDDFPGLQYLVSLDKGTHLQSITALGAGLEAEAMVLTFDSLLKNTDFVPVMKTILRKLKRHYQTPVDIEFAVDLVPNYPHPDLKIYLLQCRPLSEHPFMEEVSFPKRIPQHDIIFTANKWITSGHVSDIRYIVYVDPEAYNRLTDYSLKSEIGRAIGRINKALDGETFILMGPGRWGSSNIDLGVKVTYGDIFNAAILAEIATDTGSDAPEVSYGTHFFQDMVEAAIFPLPLYPGRKDTVFNDDFFLASENDLVAQLPDDENLAGYIKVIDVPQVTQGKVLDVVMSSVKEKAIGYLKNPGQGELDDD